MKTKRIPSLIMLLGCAVAAIASYINHYTLQKMLITILWVLVVFYVIGVAVKLLFDKYIPPVEPEDLQGDGAVIEKQIDDSDENALTESGEDDEGSFAEVETNDEAAEGS